MLVDVAFQYFSDDFLMRFLRQSLCCKAGCDWSQLISREKDLEAHAMVYWASGTGKPWLLFQHAYSYLDAYTRMCAFYLLFSLDTVRDVMHM